MLCVFAAYLSAGLVLRPGLTAPALLCCAAPPSCACVLQPHARVLTVCACCCRFCTFPPHTSHKLTHTQVRGGPSNRAEAAGGGGVATGGTGNSGRGGGRPAPAFYDLSPLHSLDRGPEQVGGQACVCPAKLCLGAHASCMHANTQLNAAALACPACVQGMKACCAGLYSVNNTTLAHLCLFNPCLLAHTPLTGHDSWCWCWCCGRWRARWAVSC